MNKYFGETLQTTFKNYSMEDPKIESKGQFDLQQEILSLKKEFDLKFGKSDKSKASDSLSVYQFLAILGQGAFGIVVSLVQK